MTSAALTLVSNLPSVVAIIGAILLALEGRDAWGWFLVAGLLLAAGPIFVNQRGEADEAKPEATLP